jgi:hypothetical protein
MLPGGSPGAVPLLIFQKVIYSFLIIPSAHTGRNFFVLTPKPETLAAQQLPDSAKIFSKNLEKSVDNVGTHRYTGLRWMRGHTPAKHNDRPSAEEEMK